MLGGPGSVAVGGDAAEVDRAGADLEDEQDVEPAHQGIIDDASWPYQVLTVQGVTTVEVLNGAFPEYAAMARATWGRRSPRGSWTPATRRSATSAAVGTDLLEIDGRTRASPLRDACVGAMV